MAPSNALSPIVVSTLPASKVTEVSAVALSNAKLPIEVTLFGISTEPSHVVCPVTTLSVIVMEPLTLQSPGSAQAGSPAKPAARNAEVVMVNNFKSNFIVEGFLLGKSPAHAKTFRKPIKAVSEKSNELAQCLRHNSRMMISPVWLAVDSKCRKQ